MHEVGLVMQAIELAEEAARPEGAVRIVRLHLRVGALSGVVPESMAFAFEVVSAGTLAEDASFEWEEVPVRCRCPSGCGEFEAEGAVYCCPSCGTAAWEIVAGRELDISAIEIELPSR